MKNRCIRQFYDQNGLLHPKPVSRGLFTMLHRFVDPQEKREEVLRQYDQDRLMIRDQDRLLNIASKYPQLSLAR